MNKQFRIMLIIVFLIIIMPISVFANTLTLKVTTDKANYKLGDTVLMTVDWTDKMQAASFAIQYDSDKLEFETANIANTFNNAEKRGEISINWTSMEEVDITKMTFKFKTIKTGEANISIKEVEAFADGNLVSPTSYDFTTLGSRNINIHNQEESSENKKENNTTASRILPKAGRKIIILPILIVLLICGIIGFIKYRRLLGI